MTNPDREELVKLADLRSANVARQKEWDAGNQLTLAYRGNELAGEVGEACNVIKKLERERIGIAGSRDTVAHLAEELADVVICADLIAMHEGIDLLGEAVPAKFNATSEKVGLKTRYEPALRRLASSGDGIELQEYIRQRINLYEDAIASTPEATDYERNELISDLGRRLASSEDAVKVRKLEWVEMPDRDPESASWIAETDLGRSYRVFAAWWGAQHKYGYVFDGFYHTEADAKAAAQADYEARIRSALVEVPAVKGEPEPVAWQWRRRDRRMKHEEVWSYVDYQTGLTIKEHPERYETRALYTQPADAGMREAVQQAIDEAAHLASIHAHHALWSGLLPYGWDSATEQFGRNLAGAIAEAIKVELPKRLPALTAPGATTKSDGVPDRESWWLIERIGTGQYTKSPDALPALTDDPWRAFRFATEREAHEARLRLVSLRDECKVTEHIFINKYDHPSDPSPTRSDVTVEELADLISASGYVRLNFSSLVARALLETHEIRRK